jgi:CO/xanthine dehydrogenase Mo-binding subunit
MKGIPISSKILTPPVEWEGEPGTSAVVPAAANTIFASYWQALRKLPVDPAELQHT